MSVEEKVTNAREVVADVGRLAARWVLWSRKRLVLALLAVLLVGLAIGQLTGPAHPGKGAATGGNNGISTGQNPAPRTDVPTPYLTPPVSHAVDEATAVKFVSAYLSHAPKTRWLATIKVLATPATAASLAGVDPTKVQGTKVTGPGTWSQAGIDVPTDAGSVTVTVDPASGLVSDIQPESAATPNVAQGK
ncbi:MAG TPA: hypothetical protein VF317_12860 [Dermatophilaceae bacterium]